MVERNGAGGECEEDAVDWGLAGDEAGDAVCEDGSMGMMESVEV